MPVGKKCHERKKNFRKSGRKETDWKNRIALSLTEKGQWKNKKPPSTENDQNPSRSPNNTSKALGVEGRLERGRRDVNCTG